MNSQPYIPIHKNAPCRRTDIQPRNRYTLYKEDLRVDFSKKCGYCGTADYYSGGQRGFHIDHFAPKKKFFALTNTYYNLVYSCPTCNIGKSDDWPSESAEVSYVGDIGYIDPCSNEYTNHLARAHTGKIIALTTLGIYIHKRLKLGLKRRQICWLIDKMESQLDELGKIIEDNPDDSERLQNFFKLTMKYRAYVGILKSE